MVKKNLLGYKVKLLPKLNPSFKFKTTWKDNEFVGVEFEVEGNALPSTESIKYYWDVKTDDSLRLPNTPKPRAYEYVCKKPVSPNFFKEKCLPYLLKHMEKADATPMFSVRCSTHIHVGVHQLYYYQVFLMVGLYFVLEELFYPLVGKERNGGLFCVGSNNSEALVRTITAIISNGGYTNTTQNQVNYGTPSNLKYSSVNVLTLNKFGTLEFRAMEGTFDVRRLHVWLDILIALRSYASNITIDDASNILNTMSIQGPIDMLATILGGKHRRSFKYIMDSFDGNQELITDMIYAGIGRSQEIFYEPNWSKLKLKEKLEPVDPKETKITKAKVGLTGPQWTHQYIIDEEPF